MDFTFDDEQLALQDVARGADWSAVRAAAAARAGRGPGGDHARPLWSTLVDLGWTGLLVPEEYGGTGAGLLETCIVLEQMGRIPLPGPFFSSAVAAMLAARALGADRAAGRPGLGRRAGAPWRSGSRATATRWAPCGPGPGARGTTGSCSGQKPLVIDGHTADWVIVVARSEEGVRSYLLESPGGELVPSLDPTRKLARLVLDDDAGHPARPRRATSRPCGAASSDDIAVGLAAETGGRRRPGADRGDRLRQGAGRLRPAGRHVPGGAAPARRHVPRRWRWPGPGVQFAAWASDTESPERAQCRRHGVELRRRRRRSG